VLYRTSAISAGVAVLTDVTNYRALLSLPGVRTVYPIAPKTIENAGVADLVNAPEVWESLDNTGQGVDVGIIDTGIDYTHTDFGGSGSVGQYNLLRRLEDRPAPARVFPNAKVVGGFDFAGDDYNASDPTSVPQPDPNPLDCHGHGSHVAGTAAGYGVNEDGSTYSGPYDTSLDLNGSVRASRPRQTSGRCGSSAARARPTSSARQWNLPPTRMATARSRTGSTS